MPRQQRHDGVKHGKDAILTQLAHIENQAEESQKNRRQQHVSPDGMHGREIDALAPIGLGLGNVRHSLKKIQAGGMSR